MNFQLRCWLLSHNLQLGCYLLDQVPTTLLTFITQLATMLSTLVTQLATTFVVIFRRELGILHEYVSHHRGEVMRKGYCGREKLVCHTGTIDAAWSALRNCIPKKLSPQSSRRRLKHWNASSDGKTCYFSDSTNTSRWKWAARVVKRENTQILASFFWRIFMKEIRVCAKLIKKKKNTCFCKHVFRSGGMFLILSHLAVVWGPFFGGNTFVRPTRCTTTQHWVSAWTVDSLPASLYSQEVSVRELWNNPSYISYIH